MNIAERIGKGAPTRLVFRSLGRFHLDSPSGTQLHLRTRKARALLAALALGGRPMARDELADLLWSDRGPAQARASLRQTLFELQRLAGGELPVLSIDREDVAIRNDQVAIDLDLIREAASNDDSARLIRLLERSEPGLLVDLDGLDTEFDDWLRRQRAHEPGSVMLAALGTAERCLAADETQAAADIVSQIIRLDGTNEHAVRLAMRIDHDAADSAAVHRRMTALRRRLHDDLDAEASAATEALFRDLADPRRREVAAAPQQEERLAPRAIPRRSRRMALALLLFIVAAALMAGLLAVRHFAAPEPPPVRIAVLPFDGDGYLAGGVSEATRAALSRNRSIRLVGRATTAAAVEQKLSPDQFRERLQVTHLLEGTVSRSGNEVTAMVSLSRTSDGLQVWQDLFRGRMGEPLSLQDEIANGIEGRLRGRLAPNGGRKAEQIATTPEVYALYNEARRILTSRDRATMPRAEALMREAVKADPNYGPAWSLLGAAIYFNGRVAIADSKRRAEGMAAARHALALAPNFAPAHATMALIAGGGSPPEARLRRAVALDPSYSEAWNWLGNSLASQHRLPEALAAYEQAVDIDPLLQPAVQNLAGIAAELGDRSAQERLLQTITKAGASPLLIGSIKADLLYLRGDHSGAVHVLQRLGRDQDGRSPPTLWTNWFDALTGLGYFEKLHEVTGCPEWYPALVAGKGLPPKTFEGLPVQPEEFWSSPFFSSPASRALVNLGRSDELVRIYRKGFRDADDFITRTGELGMRADLVPAVAVALRSTGNETEAAYLLSISSDALEDELSRFPGRRAKAQLAAIKAAQRDHGRALALLESAVRRGWLPDGRTQTLDLANDPAFRELRSNSRFRAIRLRILAHVAKERAELGPLKI